ncbi:MAG: ATPase, T2SS/T4P/T4SS family [Gammaproteobacteria bacterium]|nr:ATPase, T2SS/T4P/T4SS family [Gammaproteobacteria bacterium]MDH5735452.1 ATPase, T2SS/T4P/T4SS family [Gammaproteobacteria bacterium]
MPDYSSLFTDKPVVESTSRRDAQTVSPYQILFVDDEPNVLNALRRVFRQENYKILTAENGNEALDILKNNNIQLMISDFMMPGMNGAELLTRAKSLYPEMIRIMLTGHANTEAVMAAIKEGAVYKFILKPWNDDDLRVTVGLALEQYDLIRKNKELQKQNALKAKEIQSLTRLKVTNRSQLPIMLNKRQLLNDKQVQELYKQQQIKKEPVIKQILQRQWVDEKIIRKILVKEMMIEEVDLKEFQVDPAIAALLPASFCNMHWILPIKLTDRHLTLAMADPMDTGLLDDLRFVTGLEIQTVVANIAELQDKIKQVYCDQDVSFTELETFVSSSDPYEGIEIIIEEDDDLSIEELLLGTDEPPAIRLVNAIMLEAVRLGASDIHIHPRSKNVVVRYRIDGVLVDKIQVPHNLHMALVSRIKVMAELDITERRRPQDGRITVKTPMRVLDLRLSTLPTINGEKVVMRLLDRNSSVYRLDELGLSSVNLAKLSNVITKPQGIILTTGPTGSGKTTTLYSLLQHEATSEKNYVTIEDPVEYYLDTAGQVMIKEKIGLDFATVLRAILRQDPDVILLGEIRDYETAEVAFHAALTGHLVYSTLHTNSAVATVSRLFDLGLKPYVVASALQAIISQRLVRKICNHCKHEIKAEEDILYKLGEVFNAQETKFYKGTGCAKCNNSGYSGRAALYEILIPSEKMIHLIAAGATVLEMVDQAADEHLVTLVDDAREKVDQGITTGEEVLRVLGSQVIC